MLEKIISGGQTGADQAGLEAGRALKLQTGGTAPYNWMTDEGPQMALLKSYGLVAGPVDWKTYPIRTEMNVKYSDATVIFGDPTSPGCSLTIKYCQKHKKKFMINPPSFALKGFVEMNEVKILNVAGNRESKNPGINSRAFEVLMGAFRNG
jgi:hypothetical protein